MTPEITAADAALETGWLPATPVGDTLLRRFLHNQADVNGVVARASGGTVEHHSGVVLTDACSPVAFLNQAILMAPVLRPDDPVLDAVDSFFGGGGRPATLLSAWPTPNLAHRGWSLVGHPVFVVRSPSPVSYQRRDGIEVRLVGEAAPADELGTAERILIDGFPLDEARGAPPGAVLPAGTVGSGLETWLGLLHGEPVAVGEVFVGHGVTNLCMAATLPPARRRGVWEALVWERVATAPDLPAVAYTSDLSRPGFVRMGFLPITRFTLWLLPASRRMEAPDDRHTDR